MSKSKGLIQAYEMQDLAYEAAQAYRQNLPSGPDGIKVISKDDAAIIAGLIRAWDTAQERIRIHRGKPLPGSMKPAQKPKADEGML